TTTGQARASSTAPAADHSNRVSNPGCSGSVMGVAPGTLVTPGVLFRLGADTYTRWALGSGSGHPLPKASSSIGRVPVSKTGGWGFESLLACHTSPIDHRLGVRSHPSR